ncbi:MAG: CRISPR-associated protein Cas4 [Pseudomonadota bacterium]|nr:CRISPR-associated protein Cas4 [Pseudomonadota bacterium]
MADDTLPIPLSALQHFLYCPRQCALIHIERQWAENRHTAEGRILHARTDRPEAARRRGVRTVTAMPLTHGELGLIGVADVVEFHATPEGEQAFPIEYKRGRPKAHRADEVQLCAQAICLEAMLRRAIAEGALFYGQTHRRQAVVFDAGLRELTLQTIADTRAMLQSGQTPQAIYAPRKCEACSLIDICEPRWPSQAASVRSWLQSALMAPERD